MTNLTLKCAVLSQPDATGAAGCEQHSCGMLTAGLSTRAFALIVSLSYAGSSTASIFTSQIIRPATLQLPQPSVCITKECLQKLSETISSSECFSTSSESRPDSTWVGKCSQLKRQTPQKEHTSQTVTKIKVWESITYWALSDVHSVFSLLNF